MSLSPAQVESIEAAYAAAIANNDSSIYYNVMREFFIFSFPTAERVSSSMASISATLLSPGLTLTSAPTRSLICRPKLGPMSTFTEEMLTSLSQTRVIGSILEQ